MSIESLKSINLIFLKRFTFNRIIAASAIIGSLSLFLIALRLAPVASYSKSFNRCTNTTKEFLSTVPGFLAAGDDGLEAMSVSLCNGSTPQKAEKPSSSLKWSSDKYRTIFI